MAVGAEMSGHGKIEIPLRANVEVKQLPKNFSKSIEREYNEKYLASFGANPTRENVEFVKKNAAITSSTVLPIWAKDTLVVLPNQQVDSDSVDLSDLFRADVVVKDDSSVYVDMTKQNRKDSASGGNRKSVSEVLALKSPKFVYPAVVDYQNSNYATELCPLVDVLDVQDLTHKHVAALMKLEENNEEKMIESIQVFQHSLMRFVPFLKDSRRLGDESSETKQAVTQTLTGLLSSPLFIQFYQALYNHCCEKILVGLGHLVMERLESVDPKAYLELSSTFQFGMHRTGNDSGGGERDENGSNAKFENTHEEMMTGTLSNQNIEDVMHLYEQCMAMLYSKLAFTLFAVKAANQGFVYASTFIVLYLLRLNYKWLRPEMEYNENMDLLRKHTNKLIITMMTQLVDPSHMYPMEFFFLKENETMDPALEKNFIDRKSIKNVKGKQYLTSLPIRAVFAKGASAADTRKILQMSTRSDERLNLLRIEEKIGGARDNGPWKVPPRNGVRLPTPHIRKRKEENRAKTAKSETRPVYRTSGVVDVLTEIDNLFDSYGSRLKQRCATASSSSRQSRSENRQIINCEKSSGRGSNSKLYIGTNNGNDNNNQRNNVFSGVDFEGMLSATPTKEPQLSANMQTDLFNMTLEKIRAPFAGKHEKRTEYEMFSTVERYSPHWMSKSTRTGKPELGNTALIRFPTRPPSRETPIINLDGRKTEAPRERFKLPL